MKPDHENYDPYELLDYDVEEHLYLPNEHLDQVTADRVLYMIKTLGLNQVKPKRRKKLQEKFRRYRLDNLSVFPEIDEYPTAYEFCKRKLANDETDLDDLVPSLA